MNKEIISTMLSADSPAPINGEGKGGKPHFTKSDAMFCVSGMRRDAWDYMQCVDIMVDDLFLVVSSHCFYKILKKYPTENTKTIKLVASVALIETRGQPLKASQRIKRIHTTRSSWYRKYSDMYALALDIYNNLDIQANHHISRKLGRL